MVGLDAVVPFTDEIERGLAALDGADPATAPAACDAIDRACRRLKVFLAQVVQGEPLRGLSLLPEYEAMQRARGLKVVAASDLFFPDLSVRAPLRLAPDHVPAAAATSQLLRQRRQFQQGLLAWLRGDAAGARTMREAVVGMEALTAQPNLRSFWWTVGALMDAIVAGGLASGFGEKQLAARIDLQIRRVVEGSSKVADRLRREVLYYVAISAAGHPGRARSAAGLQAGGVDPVGRIAVGRRDPPRAAAARRARADRCGQGRLAQVHVGTGGEPAAIEADDGGGARAGDGNRQCRVDAGSRHRSRRGWGRCRR